ncbi:MAG: IS110 family transposase [Propionibacteriaceae bacterium]
MHARSVSAAAIDDVTGEVWQARFDPDPVSALAWVAGLPGPAAVAYEAGPTGYGMARAFDAAGVRCVVAAPSKMVRPAGDRVKTDTRDAMLLARYLRLDELTAVTVPSVEVEAARDLVRAREDARGDLMRARHRLSKLLLRHGEVYPATTTWGPAHLGWLRTVRRGAVWPAGTRVGFDEAHDAVLSVTARRDRLDAAIAEMAADSEFTAVTRRLCCLRGISTLTGFALAVEIGDWSRFTGKTIGAFVGLAPGEHSSGESRRVGGITKTGNGHVRRLLVEAAFHHRPAYRVGKTMLDRWAAASPQARDRGDAGNRRLHRQWVKFTAMNKRNQIATTAVARELAGWCWSLAVLDDTPTNAGDPMP